jgi:ADP-dependent phosphofructokinase/glucokinase
MFKDKHNCIWSSKEELIEFLERFIGNMEWVLKKPISRYGGITSTTKEDKEHARDSMKRAKQELKELKGEKE